MAPKSTDHDQNNVFISIVSCRTLLSKSSTVVGLNYSIEDVEAVFKRGGFQKHSLFESNFKEHLRVEFNFIQI